MAEVAFHFNAQDKIEYACRLLRKAYLKGSLCQVLAPDEDLQALDAALWTRAAGDFLAHSTDADPLTVRQRSSLHLGRSAPPGINVLVTLGGGDLPAAAQGLERIIEVVGADEADRERARLRWRQYRQQGIEPQHHDLAAS